VLKTTIKNVGQGIIDPIDGYNLVLEGNGLHQKSTTLPRLEPGQSGEIAIEIQSPADPGAIHATIKLTHYGDAFLLESKTLTVVPPPSVQIQAKLGWKHIHNATNVTVLIYDQNRLLAKFTGQTLVGGQLTISGITNIVPGQTYRVVALIPYYLPRQNVVQMSSKITVVALKRFLPLDFNGDGKFTFGDLGALLKLPPHSVFSLFIGL
jgi:hypothetical protein